jgi:GNAT superfamily N-acetyltransferase
VDFGVPEQRDGGALAASFARSLQDALSSGAAIFVAEDPDGFPLGFVHLHAATDISGRQRAHVSDVAVAEHAQGSGTGRALMEFADTWAIAHGHDRIGLTALATNARALAFYARLGFAVDTVNLTKSLPRRP